MAAALILLPAEDFFAMAFILVGMVGPVGCADARIEEQSVRRRRTMRLLAPHSTRGTCWLCVQGWFLNAGKDVFDYELVWARHPEGP